VNALLVSFPNAVQSFSYISSGYNVTNYDYVIKYIVESKRDERIL
jgi:hypothetical protein